MLFICCRVNVGTGPSEERVLITGLHAVADIYCECCKTPLGWKYVSSVGVRLVNEQHYKQEQKQERNQFCRPLNDALTQQYINFVCTVELMHRSRAQSVL